MVTLASRELNMWNELVRDEQHSGIIPLPAVDTIRFAPNGMPAVVLVAPGQVADATTVFVDVDDMPAGDRLALQGLIDALGACVGGQVSSVYHAGGLDYELVIDEHRLVELRNLPEEKRARCWALLRSIAVVCAKYPDMKASRPKVLHSRPESQ